MVAIPEGGISVTSHQSLLPQFFKERPSKSMREFFPEIHPPLHGVLRFLSRFFEEREIFHDICRLEVRHAMLVIAEEFTAAAQDEIFFRQEEAILDLAH